jgi:hypothetical protein
LFCGYDLKHNVSRLTPNKLALLPLSEEMDNDLVRLWGLVAELSDQINNNRAVTAALQAQAGVLKVWESAASIETHSF